MKRYNIWLDKSYEGDETYYDLEIQQDKDGEWVKADVALKKIERIQKRIDELEGRAKKEFVPVFGGESELHDKILRGEL